MLPHSPSFQDFPDDSDGEESACNAGDPGSIPGLGRFPGEGNGNPLQYSCLENSMDRGCSPWGRKELDMTERRTLSEGRGENSSHPLPHSPVSCGVSLWSGL
ncbi:unnamed protein product [Rangifer tarandus platyrhynchus]|uniref:Uncharacterized protein n=1 Tax=Rangifer tarandus platyrhynchus TaxID=3082113 RepID=A0ABN8YWP5_RANTA|nr:unnamed protein product [Rangifer tarandus platyrhynchus]